MRSKFSEPLKLPRRRCRSISCIISFKLIIGTICCGMINLRHEEGTTAHIKSEKEFLIPVNAYEQLTAAGAVELAEVYSLPRPQGKPAVDHGYHLGKAHERRLQVGVGVTLGM